MESITQLNPLDHYRAQALAQQAADWFRLFECITPSSRVTPQPMSLGDKLEIIGALHRMQEFRVYTSAFRHDDTRMDAFEDTVAAAVYELSIAGAVQS